MLCEIADHIGGERIYSYRLISACWHHCQILVTPLTSLAEQGWMVVLVPVHEDQSFGARLCENEAQSFWERHASASLHPLNRFRKTPSPEQIALHSPSCRRIDDYHDS